MSHPAFACIFDMNGVLVDDIPYHIIAWREYLKAQGRQFDEQEFSSSINGRTTADICGIILGRAPTSVEIRSFEEEKEALYREIYRPHRKLIPGVERILTELEVAGIPAAVGTSAPPENVSPYILEDLGIRGRFRAVIDASQVSKGKPDPEIYLKAAAALGMPPSKCIVFEDSKIGAQAARNAGMTVVGILTSHSESELAPIALAAKDFSEISVDAIATLPLAAGRAGALVL